VHLACYTPISPHPFDLERFRLENCQARHKAAFTEWLDQKKKEPIRIAPVQKKKKTRKDSDEDSFEMKKKKITKTRRAKK
jgi:hypothetical protein